jgi:hypothetical protein
VIVRRNLNLRWDAKRGEKGRKERWAARSLELWMERAIQHYDGEWPSRRLMNCIPNL